MLIISSSSPIDLQYEPSHHIPCQDKDPNVRYSLVQEYIESSGIDRNNTFIFIPQRSDRIEGTIVDLDSCYDCYEGRITKGLYQTTGPLILRADIQWRWNGRWDCDKELVSQQSSITVWDIEDDPNDRLYQQWLSYSETPSIQQLLSLMGIKVTQILDINYDWITVQGLILLAIKLIDKGEYEFGSLIIDRYGGHCGSTGIRKEILGSYSKDIGSQIFCKDRVIPLETIKKFILTSVRVTNSNKIKYDKNKVIDCIPPYLPRKGLHFFSYITLDNGKRYGVARVNNYSINPTGSYTFDKIVGIYSNSVLHNPDGSYSQLTGVLGMEDMRLFTDAKNIMYSGTLYRGPGKDTLIAYGNIDGDRSLMTSCTLLQSPFNSRCEKNWLPFLEDGKLKYIYSCDPLIILEIEGDKAIVSLTKDSPYSFLGAKGSAGPIDWKGGRLVLYHCTIDRRGSKRHYSNFFVHYNLEWEIVNMSALFKLDKEPIEFVGHMEARGDQVELYYTVDDSESYSCILVPLET